MTGPSIETGRRDPTECPGASEYGHGLTMRRVHAGGCCARWAARLRCATCRPILSAEESAPVWRGVCAACGCYDFVRAVPR